MNSGGSELTRQIFGFIDAHENKRRDDLQSKKDKNPYHMNEANKKVIYSVVVNIKINHENKKPEYLFLCVICTNFFR